MTTRSRSGAATDSAPAAGGSDIQNSTGNGTAGGSIDARLLSGVQVSLDAKLGSVALSVADLMGLKSGSVVTLDNQLNDLIDLKLNGSVVARGELVAVEDHFAVRIVEIVPHP
jgi:flagellar motor switch protein FliN/FliY